MSDFVARSDGWLLDPVRFRIWLADENGDQLFVADIHHWNLYAYAEDDRRPFLALENEDPSDIVFDTPRTDWKWGSNPAYNAEHWLYYGEDEWAPRPGPVRLEYVFVRQAVAPSTVMAPLTVVHRRVLRETRTRQVT
jgi:hypothetical protein